MMRLLHPILEFADRDRIMQTQSDLASHSEFKDLANDHTAHQNSVPSVLEKSFITGVIYGLFFSTIFWLLAAAFMRFIR